jgi:hypothetical protein
MARPGRPERNRAARSFGQLRRFHRGFNSDKVFGTHTGLLTLCSPDPQAIRPPDEKVNVLQVTLPTNFKVAKFDNDKYTAILRKLQADIEAVRYDTKARSSYR